jgi:hypothetical protein
MSLNIQNREGFKIPSKSFHISGGRYKNRSSNLLYDKQSLPLSSGFHNLLKINRKYMDAAFALFKVDAMIFHNCQEFTLNPASLGKVRTRSN